MVSVHSNCPYYSNERNMDSVDLMKEGRGTVNVVEAKVRLIVPCQYFTA